MRAKWPLPLAFSVPKVRGQRNEDRYERSSKGVWALSDGASISFDSASWARILVRRFARTPTFDRSWLQDATKEFHKLYDRDSLPWMQQAAFDKGSFASLLGVKRLGSEHDFEVLAIGDSLAVLCDGDLIQATFPYDNAEQFNRSPQLLCTNPAENGFLEASDIPVALTVRWSFMGLGQPALLCMTDALGQWVLSHDRLDPSPIGKLRGMKSQRQFTRFVKLERAANRMRRDDTTLIAHW